jgi:dihydrofolate synthase / folylpolyglutamate synthase
VWLASFGRFGSAGTERIMSGPDEKYAEMFRELGRRWPDAKVVPVLERERRLMQLLGSPQHSYPVVHVAGTNGKSSTTYMVDQLLRTFGLHVGRFTSPGSQLTDQIALGGTQLDRASLVSTYRQVAPYVEMVDSQSSVALTRFEVLTAMAYSAFARASVDAAVVEVGMGGSWDCTNVADGKVAVLTPIALDHQDYLGHSLAEISTQKAGIIKQGATVVCAGQPAEALSPIVERCAQANATLVREDVDFGVERREPVEGGQVLTLRGLGGVYTDLFLPLHGAHQAQNAVIALAAVEAMIGAGNQLDTAVVRQAFAAVSSPGRLERIRVVPAVVVDAAHNPHGMQATVAALTEDFDFGVVVGVVSVFLDKDAFGILAALEPVLDSVVVTRNTSPRAMPAQQLGEIAVKVFGAGRVHVVGALVDAIATALALAESKGDGRPDDVCVLITGSTVTVSEARQLLLP